MAIQSAPVAMLAQNATVLHKVLCMTMLALNCAAKSLLASDKAASSVNRGYFE